MIRSRVSGFVTVLGLAIALFLVPTPSRAGLMINFTEQTNFTYTGGTGNISDLAATATLSVSGQTLTIVLDNESSTAKIASFFFNAPNAGNFSNIVATSLPPQAPVINAHVDAGQQADGFGNFGYQLDFGSGNAQRLNTNTIATVTATFSGTITDSDLATLSSGGTNGGHSWVGALDWKPLVGNTGFGGGSTGDINPLSAVPEPSSIVSVSIGLVMLGGYAWRRRKAIV